MTLLRDIQEAAVDSTRPISDLLRRCKILAARLNSSEFGEWVDRELGGYPSNETLPDYRISDVNSKGSFAGYGGRLVKNAPIPLSALPEPFRPKMKMCYSKQPIGSLEDLLRDGRAGVFTAPWPADLIRVVSGDIYEHMNLVTAWQEIPRGMIVGIMEAVRSRILAFALDVERVAPDAGATSEPAALSPSQVHSFFQTNIYGGTVGNLAAGGTGVNQHVTSLVAQGDFAALTGQLGSLGFTAADIDELKAAVAADEGEKKPGLGKAVGLWIGKGITKAAEGALKVTVDVAAKVLPDIVKAYLGQA